MANESDPSSSGNPPPPNPTPPNPTPATPDPLVRQSMDFFHSDRERAGSGRNKNYPRVQRREKDGAAGRMSTNWRRTSPRPENAVTTATASSATDLEARKAARDQAAQKLKEANTAHDAAATDKRVAQSAVESWRSLISKNPFSPSSAWKQPQFLTQGITGAVVFVSLLGIGYFAKGQIQSVEYARGMISLLLRGRDDRHRHVVLTLMAALQTTVDEARFKSGKEVLTTLVGIFGTILGFYFGSMNGEKADQPQVANIKALGGVIGLNTIDLSGTNVSDEDLINLGVFPNVERLYLNNTAITDRGLTYLHKLKNLKFLSLVDTKVDPKGKAIGELRDAIGKNPVTGTYQLTIVPPQQSRPPVAPEASTLPSPAKPEPSPVTPAPAKGEVPAGKTETQSKGQPQGKDAVRTEGDPVPDVEVNLKTLTLRSARSGDSRIEAENQRAAECRADRARFHVRQRRGYRFPRRSQRQPEGAEPVEEHQDH